MTDGDPADTPAALLEFPGFRLADGPVFSGAQGDRLIDTDGRRVLDLATGFGVYLHGHGMPAPDLTLSMTAVAPGLGDLYSHELRDRTTRRLCEQAAEDWDGRDAEDLRALVLMSGSDAVETALKTALLATGRTWGDRIRKQLPRHIPAWPLV